MTLPLMTNIERDIPGQEHSIPDALEDRSQSVIVLLQYYLPGFKAGGPIRSVANLVDVLGRDLKFRIATSDRDIKDRLPYDGIETNHWIRVGNADVLYLSPGWQGLRTLISLLLSASPKDVLYINSFFSRRFSILPMLLRRMGVIKPQRVVLAPRGEFSEGALGLKPMRKKFYLILSQWLGIYRQVVFHASSRYEALDMTRVLKDRKSVV